MWTTGSSHRYFHKFPTPTSWRGYSCQIGFFFPVDDGKRHYEPASRGCVLFSPVSSALLVFYESRMIRSLKEYVAFLVYLYCPGDAVHYMWFSWVPILLLLDNTSIRNTLVHDTLYTRARAEIRKVCSQNLFSSIR